MVGQWKHTYNRGTEKRTVFLDVQDYARAVHDLYEFNDEDRVINFNRRLSYDRSPTSIIPIGSSIKKVRKMLLDIFAWAFMPNHYHFFSREKRLGASSKFHQKWGTGYTNYFNIKYERSGTLFQGKHKKVLVDNDIYAAHLVCYIHANLLDLWRPGWKETGLKGTDIASAIKFLNNKKNRWSSHQDYWGIKNFPSVISTEFRDGFFGGCEGYQRYFTNWLKRYKRNEDFLRGLKLTLD